MAAGLYMMLRRSIVKLVIGLVLLSHAANLLIFTAGRLNPEHPECLGRLEQDLLGHALLACDRRDFRAAQELLDQLHHGHQLRMALQHARSGREVNELGRDE